MVNILQLISPSSFLGAERVVAEICNNISNNYNVSIGLLLRDDSIYDLFRNKVKKTVSVIPFKCSSKLDLTCLSYLRSYVKNNDIKIIHSHGYKSNYYSLFTSLGSKKIKIISTNHLWKDRTKSEIFYKYVDVVLLRYFDANIAVSRQISENMGHYSIDVAAVIDNGVHVDNNLFDSTLKNRIFPLNEFEFVIGSVGSLTTEKGHIDLLRAMVSIKEYGISDIKMRIIGEGPERHRLEEFIMANNLGADVSLEGYVPNVRDIYSQFDLFVLPSYNEGLPMVMLEAMASGVAVIATRVGGIPNAIHHGLDGLVVTPGDVQGIVNAIIKMRNDPKLLKKISINGYRLICKNYSGTTMSKCYEQIYQQVID